MPSALRAAPHAAKPIAAAPVIAQELQRDRRLRVLLTLGQAPVWTCNESVLKNVLRALGHAVSTDLLRTELAWLHEQGLLELEQTGDLYVARLVQRGEDVARGAAQQPGVAPPTE